MSKSTDFDVDKSTWQGKLYLEELTFLENGKTLKPWWTWTKGVLIHHGDQTASHYEIREMNGQTYMFLERKSGDYTIRHMKPKYYVLKKKKISASTASEPSLQGVIFNYEMPERKRKG